MACGLFCLFWSLSHVQLFYNPMDCSPPGSSTHGILQAKILKWVAMPSFRGSFWPRDLMSPALAGRFFTTEPRGKPLAQIEKFCLIFYIRSLYDSEMMQMGLRASGKWHRNSSLTTKFWNVSVTSFHELDHIRNSYTNMTLTYLLSWMGEKFLVLKPFHWLQPCYP